MFYVSCCQDYNYPLLLPMIRERPKINSSTVDIEKLKSYPDGTLGREYTKFLEVNVS